MKKTLKSVCIAALMSLASVFVFTGCEVRESVEDFIDKNNLNAQVTYYAHKDTENKDAYFENNLTEKDIYYKDGQKVFNIGTDSLTSGTVKLTYENYEFVSWNYVAADENGELQKDENGDLVLGEEVDFSKPITKGEHWHICANWVKLSVVKVMLVSETNITVSQTNAETGEPMEIVYKPNDEIREYPFDNKGTMQSTSNAPVTPNDATFLEFYANAECTQSVSWPIIRPEDRADVVIYAKYIPGKWTLLRDADDVKTLFSNKAGQKNAFYLLNDIDCTQLDAIAPANIFNSKLQGNGYTISNLTFEKENMASGTKVAMFGDIKAEAVIENITFTNLTINYSVRPSAMINAYLVGTNVAEGATINNVSMDARMVITLGDGALLANTLETNWQFGGFESDKAYMDKYKNAFTFTEETNCTVKNN